MAPIHGPETGPLVFAIGASQPLGERISAHLGIELAPIEERDFEGGEHKLRPLMNVRNRDVYVVHSLNGDADESPNDKLVRLLFFIGTLKDAAAARVTAVVPYLCYARKDRQTKPRDPITTRYVAQLFEALGTDRIITMEAHNIAAFQNAFRCDSEHLDANAIFAAHFQRLAGDRPLTVASPDTGGMKRTELLRERLERMVKRPVGTAFMEKHRSSGKVTGELFAGEVAGRTVIVLDDLISTGGTMARMAAACKEHGAEKIYLAATHGVFSERTGEILATAPVEGIVITDTVALPTPPALQGRLAVLSVAKIFAEAIRRCHTGESIVELLAEGPESAAG